MIARTTRTICELLAASLLGVMLLVGIAGWRLSQGPVPLNFLTTHFVRALNGQDAPFQVMIDKTNLAWAGWDRMLNLRVVGVSAVGNNGRVVAQVPEVLVSISIAGLMNGIVAPTSLDIIGPMVRLGYEETGAFTKTLGNSVGKENEIVNSEIINRFLLAVQSAPDPDRPTTYLRRVSVLDAQLIIDDQLRGVIWEAPQADIILLKEDGELRGTFFAQLDIGGSNAKLNGAASWRPNSGVIRMESEFSGVKIDRLATKLQGFKGMEAVRLDIQGRAALTVSTNGILQTANFNLDAGKGEFAYAHLWPKALQIGSAQLSGWFDGKKDRLEIEHFEADLGGLTLTGHASAIKQGEGLKIDGALGIDKMALSQFKKYWPQGVAADTRQWVIKSLPSGDVADTSVKLSIIKPDLKNGAISLKSMSGTFKLVDTTFHYLDGLPPMKNVAASAVFSRDHFTAKIAHATSAGLTVTFAQVRLTDLQSDKEQAEIDVSVDGSLADALALIDRSWLGYASRFGFSPGTVGGQTKTQLKLKFPILNELPLSKVDIQTSSLLRNLSVPNLAFGRTVSAETLLLRVDKNGIELGGQANISGIEAAIKWTELFGDDEHFTRRYEAKAVLNQTQRDSIGLINLSPFVEGPLAVDISVLEPRNGPREIALKLALRDTKIWLPGFRWRKHAGLEGVAWLRLLVHRNGTLNVQEFSVGSPGLSAKGSIDFDRYQRFTRMKIKKFTLGRTNLSGRIHSTPYGKLKVKINGTSLDAATFLDPNVTDSLGDKKGKEDLSMPPVDLTLNVDRVWFDNKTPVYGLEGHLEWDKTEWRKVDLVAFAGNDQKITVAYVAKPKVERLVVRSDNAGNALRALDIIDTVQGGTMTLSATKKLPSKINPWKGSLDISDFILVKAPMLAKVLTIASLTGIGDTLSGKGIRFAKLETPFEFRDGVATIRNARTVGAQLGFTAEGTINTLSDRVKLSGTIVPAYTLNSALGKIPVLGRIFTGKKGSGIFAATYRIEGPLEKPKIWVNPLAALAPGFLRNLVSVFDGGVKPDKDSRPGSADTE